MRRSMFILFAKNDHEKGERERDKGEGEGEGRGGESVRILTEPRMEVL
jgi:hypothetical protein